MFEGAYMTLYIRIYFGTAFLQRPDDATNVHVFLMAYY